MIAALAFRSDLQNECEPAARSSMLFLSAEPLGNRVDRLRAMLLRSPLPNCKRPVYEREHYAEKQPVLGWALCESQRLKYALSSPEKSACDLKARVPGTLNHAQNHMFAHLGHVVHV